MLIQNKTIWTPDNSFLLEYHARIECGEIIVGRELWLELERLREDFYNDSFIYDTDDALLRMNFMENCIRLTKSPYYGKPMLLMLWQKAFIEAIYSFKMSATTLRRFQKVLLIIGRKNTKSETCSAIGLTEFFVGNAGSVICCSSNDDAQASINHNKMDTMRRMLDPDDQDSARNQSHIYNKANNSEIIKISDRTRNKEGRDIDVVLLDESNMMKDNEIAMACEQSQSLKDEPLFLNMTTEGMVVDGYLDKELVYARKIIYGEIEDDDPDAIAYLPWLYTQDSEQEIWQNRASWVKSNPTLIYGVKKWSYLDKQIAKAKQDKGTKMFVLCKDFNIKQNSAQSWLNLEDYDYKAVFNLEEFKGSKCLGAVDLSETTDLTTAKILLMKPDDHTKYVYTKYFIPESKLENSDDRNAGAKYKEWAEAGLITITEGNDIDLSRVADWFYSLYTDHNIRLWKCGYDQRFAKEFLTRMEYYGWSKGDELVMILQNAQTLSNAIKLLEADFKHQLVNYNDNPVDKWCLKNACLKVNDLQQCLIIKAEPSKRIDGAVCKAILWEMYRQNRTEWRQMIGGNKNNGLAE